MIESKQVSKSPLTKLTKFNELDPSKSAGNKDSTFFSAENGPFSPGGECSRFEFQKIQMQKQRSWFGGRKSVFWGSDNKRLSNTTAISLQDDIKFLLKELAKQRKLSDPNKAVKEIETNPFLWVEITPTIPKSEWDIKVDFKYNLTMNDVEKNAEEE